MEGECEEMMAEEMARAWIWVWGLALTHSGHLLSDCSRTQAQATKARVEFYDRTIDMWLRAASA